MIVSRFLFLMLSFLMSNETLAKEFYSQTYMGEKRLDNYSERYYPIIEQDIYRGKLQFSDDVFFQNFFSKDLFSQGPDLGFFINSELYSAQTCTNTSLNEHFDDIKYSYRLITFSYLLEGLWHLNEISKHLQINACKFDLKELMKSCRPKNVDMSKFVERIISYNPKYQDRIDRAVTLETWWKEYQTKKYSMYSHYKLAEDCGRNCLKSEIPKYIASSCNEHQDLMKQICSETDEVWGLSEHREAYHLLSTSNIINTFNKRGEAVGCLRRFSEIMASREPNYKVLKGLFPPAYDYLKRTHKERFLQGRVFFYGAAKEFEEKGLADIWVKDQTLVVESLPEVVIEEPKVIEAPKVIVAKKKEEPKPVAKVEAPGPAAKIVKLEVPIHPKSAFLQAAEVRKGQSLDRLEVDMLKLKYDYVFTLSMTNTLSERLKSFMTREALKEMASYDHLGDKKGPVPLLFIKFMIDFQEHQGLWNLVSVLGNSFYVSNEIDSFFKPEVEKIELINDSSTNGAWTINIVRP